MKQARSEATKRARAKRREKAVELQCALEDRRAAQALMRELADMGRSSTRWAARFQLSVKPATPATRTSSVRKRVQTARTSSYPEMTSSASTWVIDDRGMRGIIWQQAYLRRGTAAFHPGAAREIWEYVVRDEAVMLDAGGEPIIIENMGQDWVEIGWAWQAMEDASTRENAKIQIRAVVPLDADMRREEMIAAVEHFCETNLAPLGLPYSAVIHRAPEGGDNRNDHAHILFSLRPMRRIEPYCWEVADGVCGELDGKNGIQMLRHLWAHSMTEAAERARSNRAYTGLGYGARGLDLEAGEHLGEGLSTMVRRGTTVWAHERNRIKAARNAARLAIRDADRKIAALTKVRDAALARIAADQAGGRGTRILTQSKPVVQPVSLASTALSVQPADRIAPTSRVVSAHERQIATASLPIRRSGLRVSPADKNQDRNRPIMPSRPSVPATSLQAGRPFEPGSASLTTPVMTTNASRLAASAGASSRPKTALVPASSIAPVDAFVGEPGELLRLIAEARVARRKKQAALETERRHAAAAVAPSPDLRPVPGRQARGLATTKLPPWSRRSPPPTLADMPRRDRLEADALERAGGSAPSADRIDRALLDRLAHLDPYVMAYSDRALEIAPDAIKALGLDTAWMRSPQAKQALSQIRAEQQSIVETLAREAAIRPLDFAGSGPRFWPRDLDPKHLRRLDRWASDPGFEQDIVPVELVVHQAHEARRRQRMSLSTSVQAAAPRFDRPIADGFGGWRDTPAPHVSDVGTGVRIDAFDARSGRPADHLLLLLKLAGDHPRMIAFASDGRLMATGGPPIMASLLHGWREDERVVDLVTATVRLSREAGGPAWPPQIAASVRAYAARNATSLAAPRRDPGREPTL